MNGLTTGVAVMSKFHKVADTGDVLDGEMKSFLVHNVPVVICNLNNNLYAFRDECSHELLPLADGEIEDGKVICAYHGAEFDVKTGEAMCLPAIEPIETYEVKVEENDILVKID